MLSPLIIGPVEAGQQDPEVSIVGDIDAENFAGDVAVDAFGHAVGLERIGACHPMIDLGFADKR